MAITGADIAALRGFARALKERSDRINVTLRELEHTVVSLQWVGPDRERFLQSWSGHHRPGLQQVCDSLNSSSQTVMHHANVQEQASR